MGASESKLVFKQKIFKLSEQKDIAANDAYWAAFWELPETVQDVFSLFSSADIRRIRDQSPENLETLLLAVTWRLIALRNHPSFPDQNLAPERDALNCVRVLTRLLPFLYEDEHLEAWEEQFFWGARRRRVGGERTSENPVLFDGSPTRQPHAPEGEFEEVKPLAEELIDTLIALLFFPGITLPAIANSPSKISFSIWQSGIGCNKSPGTSPEMENYRMEILRLLLTLTSRSMYTHANVLPVQGVRAITYIATLQDKQLVLTLLCSLLNTTLRYNPTVWRVPYDHVVFKDPKQVFVSYCLQLLLVLVVYPVPESPGGIPPRNNFRHFMGRIHRPQDFQFLFDGITRILNQPLQATSSYLPGSQKSLSWAPEMIMLFWEILQCNRRFRSFVVSTDRAHDCIVLLIFYATQYRNEYAKQGIVRMCVFVLQTLSVESDFGKHLNAPFEGHDTLPQMIRIPDFHGTYGDFLIMSIYTLITTSQGKLDAIYPALLAILNNIAPYLQDVSREASSKLLQLFYSMSSPAFLLANESNHGLLHSLLEVFNAIIENQKQHCTNLLYAILRTKKRFLALRDFAAEGGPAEMERQAQLRKEQAEDPRMSGNDGPRNTTLSRPPTLQDVPEESAAFSIGDDSDSDDGAAMTPRSPTQSASNSVAPSVSSAADDIPFAIRGMSEKARGKLPVGMLSRHSSTTSLGSVTLLGGSSGPFEPSQPWIETWFFSLPLGTILMVIDELSPVVPEGTTASSRAQALHAIRESNLRDIEPSPVRVHLFEWSPLALGWYESLLWSFIFTSEMAMSKGAAGVWNGTHIKLFRVQETSLPGPSLLAPRGAVDAVGSNLVQRIKGLNLRGAAPGTSLRNSTGGTLRDV